MTKKGANAPPRSLESAAVDKPQTAVTRGAGPIDSMEILIQQMMDVQRDAARKIAILHDMNMRLASENEALREITHRDSLTGLYNRGYLEEQLNMVYQDNRQTNDRRNTHGNRLLMIDLNWFKTINDTLGHLAGDEALKIVARFLTNCVRVNDVVARIGGDEFVVLMRGAQEADARRKMNAIIEGFMSLDFIWEGKLYPVCASVGNCPVDPDMSPRDIIKSADCHMYEVKKLKGPNPYVAMFKDYALSDTR